MVSTDFTPSTHTQGRFEIKYDKNRTSVFINRWRVFSEQTDVIEIIFLFDIFGGQVFISSHPRHFRFRSPKIKNKNCSNFSVMHKNMFSIFVFSQISWNEDGESVCLRACKVWAGPKYIFSFSFIYYVYRLLLQTTRDERKSIFMIFTVYPLKFEAMFVVDQEVWRHSLILILTK